MESTKAGFVTETEDCNVSLWVLCSGMAGVQTSTSCLHASCCSPHTDLLPPSLHLSWEAHPPEEAMKRSAEGR